MRYISDQHYNIPYCIHLKLTPHFVIRQVTHFRLVHLSEQNTTTGTSTSLFVGNAKIKITFFTKFLFVILYCSTTFQLILVNSIEEMYILIVLFNIWTSVVKIEAFSGVGLVSVNGRSKNVYAPYPTKTNRIAYSPKHLSLTPAFL